MAVRGTVVLVRARRSRLCGACQSKIGFPGCAFESSLRWSLYLYAVAVRDDSSSHVGRACRMG